MNVPTSKVNDIMKIYIWKLTCNYELNRYWEANLRDKKPSESNMDAWIRAKYEQKRWAMKGPIPDPSTLGGEDDEFPEVIIMPDIQGYT